MSSWDLNFTYTTSRKADAFTLTMAQSWSARITGVYGPSGSGKTTLIEILLGLRGRHQVSGAARIDGIDLFDSGSRRYIPTRQRRFGWVPQDGSLFPHMTVRDNIGFSDGAPLELAKITALLELNALQDRLPHELSGGERQRVALGRALALGSSMLLLDEPLASLDLQRRRALLATIKGVSAEMPVSMLYISHDWNEIVELCDYALLLRGGRVASAGRPDQLSP